MEFTLAVLCTVHLTTVSQEWYVVMIYSVQTANVRHMLLPQKYASFFQEN